VDLSLTDDQQMVRSVFGDLFDKEATLARVRAAEDTGFDAGLWEALTEAGAVVMGAPEDLGGGGAGAIDLALIAEEHGRSLAPVPLIEALAAVHVLSGTEAGAAVIEEIAEGEVIPTVALLPLQGGVARLAPAGAVADLIVALDGDELVAVRRRGERPYAAPPENLGSQPIADWDLAAAGQERTVLAFGAEARDRHADAVALWRGLTASALNGLRKRAMAIGVEYVKNRKAFGQPIAMFQAIQHRLADQEAAGQGVELLAYEAAWAREAEPERARALAGMALLAAASSAFATTREVLQFHGGYGYTLEYDIQLFFRRAKAWPLAGGALTDQYQDLAAALWAGAGVAQEA